MAASASKSKGAGTILLVLVLLVGVAGASAFFIHKILTGEDPIASIKEATGLSALAPSGAKGTNGANGTGGGGETPRNGAPAVLTPGETVGQGETTPTTATSDPVPPGQFVVPPTGAPDVFAENQAGNTQTPGTETDPFDNGLVPPTYEGTYEGAYADGDAPEPDSGMPADPAPNLLLVPGAIEPPPAAAREDAVVRPAFVDDIAAFLAQNYWPKNTHPSARRSGITTASLQWANLRYGAELRDLDGRRGDPGSARRAILGYILNPAAVGRIYDLYAEGFIAALRQEADKRLVGEGNGKRALTAAEKKEMFGIYAGYASRVAAALDNYAADSTMPKKVEAYAGAERTVQDANRAYMESMLAFEETSLGTDTASTNAARLRMDKEAATYQKRVREREAARDALVSAMSKGKAGRDDTLVYTAFWAYRRGADSASSLRACAKTLGDMSAKLNAASRQIQ